MFINKNNFKFSYNNWSVWIKTKNYKMDIFTVDIIKKLGMVGGEFWRGATDAPEISRKMKNADCE